MTQVQVQVQVVDLGPPSKAVLEKAARRLAKARIRLLLNPKFVFWATCALHFKLVPVPGLAVAAGGHIGTDGTHLFYDPVWIADERNWDDEELVGIVAHEVSHAVKGDGWRRGGRRQWRWNIAADARINPELMKAGLTLPKYSDPKDEAILQNPANFGLSAEHIYNTLPPECDGGGAEGEDSNPVGGSNGAGGDVREPKNEQGRSLSENETADLERKWTQIARQAAQIAKGQGHLPAGMEEFLAPIRPTLDPWAVLRQFLTMTRRDDFSWRRPNRRALHRGIVLPSMQSEGVGELVIAVDTSGSMDKETLTLALGFIDAVLSECRPERTHFIEVDAAFQKYTEFGPGDMLPESVPIHGRGGTDMRPVWTWIEENEVEPVCAIVISDMGMDTASFGTDPGFPVLWISTTRGAAGPFGTTVEMLS